jgi:ankyrin repeat/SOCS box protein 13
MVDADRSGLIFSCQTGQVSCIQTLIAYGADINFQERCHKVSCLQRCCTFGKTECLDVLLQAGANTELKDWDGDRPIQQAVFSERPECVKLLIAHGTNLFEKNNGGRMAIDFAGDNAEIKAILQWAMANPLTLKQQCRIFIRKLLGATKLNNISDLDIPQTLKLYLKFGVNG